MSRFMGVVVGDGVEERARSGFGGGKEVIDECVGAFTRRVSMP